MIPKPTDGSISIAARSPGLDVDAVEVVVTIPTFRRPQQVLETLASIRAQVTSRRFAIIVMENDAERREGVAALTPAFEHGGAEGFVIIAHERGNCSAYNAGWETALRPGRRWPSCTRRVQQLGLSPSSISTTRVASMPAARSG